MRRGRRQSGRMRSPPVRCLSVTSRPVRRVERDAGAFCRLKEDRSRAARRRQHCLAVPDGNLRTQGCNCYEMHASPVAAQFQRADSDPHTAVHPSVDELPHRLGDALCVRGFRAVQPEEPTQQIAGARLRQASQGIDIERRVPHRVRPVERRELVQQSGSLAEQVGGSRQRFPVAGESGLDYRQDSRSQIVPIEFRVRIAFILHPGSALPPGHRLRAATWALAAAGVGW